MYIWCDDAALVSRHKTSDISDVLRNIRYETAKIKVPLNFGSKFYGQLNLRVLQ